ncbi:MAG: tail fiber domain-containing protein [Candidatus Taylorbacteria bacterium]|nr:tail fiber domain-containing protein [Candidatus Taylorbacteria bacterium]
MSFESDAGVLAWTDLPVTSASAQGVKQSYTAQLNGNSMLTVYGESDGVGGVQNLGVGIGSTTPWGYFSINPNGIGSNRPLFNIGSSTASQFMVGTSGFVGIGTTSPQRLLHVYRSTDGAPVRFEDANGYCEIDPTSTSWTCTSDRSLKKDITDLSSEDTMTRIAALNAVSFKWNKDGENDPLRYGFIAQDVEAIFPELVITADNGLKSVMYGGFTPFIVEAVKELHLSIQNLESRVTDVEGRLAILELAQQVGSGTTSTSTSLNASSTIDTIAGWLASLGATLQNAVATFVAIVADTVTANFVVVNDITTQTVNAASVYAGALQVGTTTNPGGSGITIVDRVTGQPFCMFIANGVMQSAAGSCDNPNNPANQPGVPGAAEPDPEPEPEPVTETGTTTPDGTEEGAGTGGGTTENGTSTPAIGDTASTTPDGTDGSATTTPALPDPTPEPPAEQGTSTEPVIEPGTTENP